MIIFIIIIIDIIINITSSDRGIGEAFQNPPSPATDAFPRR
jgi:hypothetical protein